MGRSTLWQITCEPPLGLAITFCLGTRLIFHYLYGLSYDSEVIWWQMLDSELLRTAPFQSIYLMHMQPPLLNALYAVALALPGEAGFVLLHILFVGSSLAIVTMLYAFMRRFGARPLEAGLGAALFGVLPQVLLYENIYFYSHLEAVLALAAATFASAYFEERRLAPFVGLAISLVILALLRSLFHLGWVAVVLISACALASRHEGWDRRPILVTIAAILAVSAVYLKNLKEFGFFGASSWDGVSLMSMVLPNRGGDASKFPQAVEDLRKLEGRGGLSTATVAALRADDIWQGWVGLAEDCGAGDEQRRVLCAIKRLNGELNFNHVAMIGYSQSLGRDAWRLLRSHPRVYLDRVGSSLLTFLGKPSWDYRRLPFKLKAYTDAWNGLMLYQPWHEFRGTGRPVTAWWESVMNRAASASVPLVFLVLVGSIFIMCAGIAEFVGYWRQTRSTADWVFPMMVLALFVSVPNLINGAEAERIRYSIEPVIYLAVFAFGLRLIGRRRHVPPSPARGGINEFQSREA